MVTVGVALQFAQNGAALPPHEGIRRQLLTRWMGQALDCRAHLAKKKQFHPQLCRLEASFAGAIAFALLNSWTCADI
jgi:hypothetical protein